MPLLILILLFLIFIVYIFSKHNQNLNIKYNFEVSYHDQFYELNPGQKHFESKQTITIINVSHQRTNLLFFRIHPDLEIKTMNFKDSIGNVYSLKKWIFCGRDTLFNQYRFQIVKVQLGKYIEPGEKLFFYIHYEMKPSAIMKSPIQMYDFTISSRSSYAICPYIGNNPVFSYKVSTPFKLAIKYPQNYISCVPGELISTQKESGYITDVYECETPNVPTFSCAPYQKIVHKEDDIVLEYYLYPNEIFNKKAVDYALKLIKFYQNHFGFNKTQTYKIATVGRINSFGGGENKGNTIYLTDSALKRFRYNKNGKWDYFRLLSHELFHNWNLFHLYWEGNLGQWFGEGGANFISAWAAEKIINPDAGRYFRSEYLWQFINQRAFHSTKTLQDVQKTGLSERSLIYNYGALVWEQLRLKLGDDSFFTGLSLFFKKYGGQEVTKKDLINCFQTITPVNVKDYLKMWTDHNAQIEFSISNVEIIKNARQYTINIEISMKSKKEYELFTAIGYKTSANEKLNIIPLKINRTGKLAFTFKSDKEPVYIQLDPNFQVPHLNPYNCIWRNPNSL